VRHQTYCSFCSLPQKVYSNKHVGFFALFMLAIVSVIVTYLVWGEFHIAGPLLFVIFASVAEWTHRLRWRYSIKCKSCGFDPLLYKSAPAEAAQTVKAFLDNRKKDPLYLLKPQPRIKPIIKKVKKYTIPPRSKELDI
jgi:hypothetical protein